MSGSFFQLWSVLLLTKNDSCQKLDNGNQTQVLRMVFNTCISLYLKTCGTSKGRMTRIRCNKMHWHRCQDEHGNATFYVCMLCMNVYHVFIAL